MDEHNVHHFWGISPAIDLGALVPTEAASLPVDQPIRLLQVAPYDARHTLTTICRAERHPHLREAQQPVQLLVWEDSPEGLVRHVLLLAVLLDGSLPPRERTELLLELHGNVVLRERAASYLDEKARQMEALVVELAAGAAGARQQAQGPGEAVPDNGLGALRHMLDVSMLKYQERDLVVEALQRWRSSVPYDAVKGWDARARKWYGDRYDFRRNMVDWDYHMRLQPAGTPGGDPAAGSIIHFHHFRHWRMHGVAHELRDSHYNQPNRSLLSTAYGRTKEFKDRQLRDVGRSVSAWGLWCDALNSPYHALGTLAEDPAFYRVSNKQFVRTAVDIAEHNVMSLLHELRTGERMAPGSGPGGEPHRAKVARGPTSLEDLTGQQEGPEGQQGQEQGGEEPGQRPDGPVGSAGQGQECATTQHPVGTDGATEGAGSQPSASEASGAGPQGTGTEAAPHAMPTYRSGGKAQVAKSMAAAAAAMAGGAGQPAEAGGEQRGQGGEAGSGAVGAAGPSAQPAGAPAGAGGSQEEDAARQKMAAEEAALRAVEAAQDAEGARRACRFRLVLLTGDLAKGLTGRAKFGGCVSALTLGHRHIHMLGPEYGLQRVAAPGAQLVAENARHVLQLTKEQAAAFSAKVDELAAAEGAGWERVVAPPVALGLTEAHQLYRRPTGVAAGASSG